MRKTALASRSGRAKRRCGWSFTHGGVVNVGLGGEGRGGCEYDGGRDGDKITASV